MGLFATEVIPAGTCVICEPPLLRIPENQLHLAWGPYCRLSNAQKNAYDSLHRFKPEELDLEHAARMYLIDPKDTSLDDEDVDELVQDQVRVMSIFSCNNFESKPSPAVFGQAVFETAARLNHSCVPNVHHSYNPTLKKLTVHANRDIEAGEELCTTYLGGPGNYYVRSQRLEILRSNYGFTCKCPACSDATGASDGRRNLMANLAFGVQVFYDGKQQGSTPTPYVPTDASIALRYCEDVLMMLGEEGIISLEVCKAYRMASTLALRLRMWEKARDYALTEAYVERLIIGNVVADLVASGTAAECWLETVRKQLVKVKFMKPEAKFKRQKTEAQKAKKRARTAKKRADQHAARVAANEADAKKREEQAAEQAKREADEAERKRNEYELQFPTLS